MSKSFILANMLLAQLNMLSYNHQKSHYAVQGYLIHKSTHPCYKGTLEKVNQTMGDQNISILHSILTNNNITSLFTILII